MVGGTKEKKKKNEIRFWNMFNHQGRDANPDLATSPRRQPQQQMQQQTMGGLRPREPPPMVIQGDFRKVSGISTEIFRQIETVENDHDATTAAALEAVDRRGEMVVRMLDARHMGRAAQDAVKRFLMLQDSKHAVHFVEIVKRPGQTLGLYIREGNGGERNEGVFISRIALESPVYHSGCLHVSDEILAVNLVDVTRISLDDVVIIMSIPRRLVLTTRRRRGMATGPGGPGTSSGIGIRSLDMKQAPPVVVMKKELDLGDDCHDGESTSNGENGLGMPLLRDPYAIHHSRQGASATLQRIPSHHSSSAYSAAGIARAQSQQQLGLTTMAQDSDPYLYYNSRPEYARHHQDQQQSQQPQQHQSWAPYQPPPPPITTQPKPSMSQQHFQPFDRNYPKTLESLAEKSTASYYPYQVHSFYGGPGSSSTTGRRSSHQQPVSRLMASGALGLRRGVPRSGSDQHLPRVDSADVYDYVRQRSKQPQQQQQQQPLGYRGYSAGGTVGRRRTPSLDYASDTEATTVPRRSYLQLTSSLAAAEHRRGQYTAALQSLQAQHGLRSNSLPRDYSRGRSRGLVRFERNNMAPLAHDYDSDSALSAPEMPLIKRGRVPSSPSIFTSDEYRAWMQRTPSTSAIYDRLRHSSAATGRSSAASDILSTHRPRFTFSAENLTLIDRDPSLFSTLRSSPVASTLDRNNLGRSSFRGEQSGRSSGGTLTSSASSTSLRRMRHLLEDRNSTLGSTSALSSAGAAAAAALRGATTPTDPRSRILDINPAEFLKYKMEKSTLAASPTMGGSGQSGVSGLLWVHLLAGRGLKATPTPGARGALSQCRDLYCVLECDRVHKARTVVRTGELVFEWDETFELDLVDNRQLDLLIYSWDPHFRHKLCYKGSLNISQLMRESTVHQLALRIEPRGTLYLKLRNTPPRLAFRRNGHLGLATRSLFGADLDAVVARESGIAAVTGAGGATSASVPVLVRRCVEEVERRGLDIIGLYRLCGSATKKRILREAFERNPRTVDLSPDNVPDINVITGVLKDYLRELPEPLFTKCLYQMLLDALSVCLPDDPEGNAKLMFSILDCLPKVNRCTLIYLMDHLALVVSQSDRNKMVPQNLAVCFGPVLMLQSDDSAAEVLDFVQPISVLKYLLEIWPIKSARTHFLSQQWSFPQTVREVASSRTGKHAPQPQLPRLTRLSNSLSSGNVRTSSTLAVAGSQNSSNWLRQGVTPSPLQQQPGVIGRDAGVSVLTTLATAAANNNNSPSMSATLPRRGISSNPTVAALRSEAAASLPQPPTSPQRYSTNNSSSSIINSSSSSNNSHHRSEPAQPPALPPRSIPGSRPSIIGHPSIIRPSIIGHPQSIHHNNNNNNNIINGGSYQTQRLQHASQQQQATSPAESLESSASSSPAAEKATLSAAGDVSGADDSSDAETVSSSGSQRRPQSQASTCTAVRLRDGDDGDVEESEDGSEKDGRINLK